MQRQNKYKVKNKLYILVIGIVLSLGLYSLPDLPQYQSVNHDVFPGWWLFVRAI